jgi:hypothetical protein
MEARLRNLPERDHEDYAWVNPSDNQPKSCVRCHEEIHGEWSASAHGHSANGKRFLHAYADLLHQYPDGAGVCASCHAPTAETFADLRELSGVAAEGVHCDYCHKISDVAKSEFGLTHGRFGLKLLRPGQGQLFFGPVDDAVREENAYSPLYRESRYCAACHEGVVFGVHVYSTYSEWLASPARQQGKECQTCHMKPTGHMTNIAPGHGGIERNPQTLGNHRFFAGSLADMLRQSVNVSIATARRPEEMRVAVAVTARDVGHRVPTGFIDRHLLLVVEAVDSQGKAVTATSGPVLSELAGAELAGKAGKLYGKVRKDFDGKNPASFWRSAGEVVDTRLEPEKADSCKLVFPASATKVRVRLLYRQSWYGAADSDNEIAIVDETP